MKKLAALFLALVFMCSFVTAGQAYPDTSLEGQSAAGLEGMQAETFISLHAGPKAAADGEASMLVVYFSMPETTDPDNMTQEEANSTVVIDGQVLGNTQYVAYLIEEYTGADIFRIEPEIPYPTDHDTLVDLALEEQNSHARPALAAQVENIEDYDVIFLGYPNWWGDMPMILYTFLENTDLSGKTIVPFNTHGGSGFSDTINTIATLQPEARVERNGFSESRNTVAECAEDVRDWLEELGYLSSFVPVTGIAGVPSEMMAGGSLPLTGDVQPADASSRDIVWTVRDAGETGAAIEGNLLTAERAGRVIVRAAIEDGIAPGIPFTADFSIAVAAGEASLPGDVNENGRVEIEDVMSACRVLARQTAGASPTAEEYRLCDLDGSGTVDISDIMGICRILAGAA